MQEEIQKLIASGDTEKALALLATVFPSDAALIQAQYASGKKEYNLSLIGYSDWRQIQAKVNFSVLELAGKPAPATGNTATPAPKAPPAHEVFISYSRADKAAAQEVKKFLENEGCSVLIDEEDISAGGSIMAFIQNSIRSCDAVVSIVSANSLQSDWVGGESVSSMYAVWLAEKKFIPVRLDDVVFDIDFQIAAQETLNRKIGDLKTKLLKLEDLGGDSRAFRDDLNRMNELKNNLGIILQRLKSVLMPDIRGDNFSTSMKKVIDEIRR